MSRSERSSLPSGVLRHVSFSPLTRSSSPISSSLLSNIGAHSLSARHRCPTEQTGENHSFDFGEDFGSRHSSRLTYLAGDLHQKLPLDSRGTDGVDALSIIVCQA